MGITTGEIQIYRNAEKDSLDGYSNYKRAREVYVQPSAKYTKVTTSNYVENWSNAGGYGLLCNKQCAERKDREAAAKRDVTAQTAAFNQQALASLNAPTTSGMSTGAILGITLGSLAGIGLLVFAIKKMKK